jgi:hypothetical protein
MNPEVGAKVLHHGRLHEILDFPTRARKDEKGKPVLIDMVRFENDRFRPTGQKGDLVWNEAEGWWYLPGRVLSNDERALVQTMTGMWPAAESHLAMRKVLDVEGPFKSHINFDKLKVILAKGKRFPIWQEEGESEKAFDKRLTAYANKCLAHCEELRAFRKGEKEDVIMDPAVIEANAKAKAARKAALKAEREASSG